MPHCCGRKTGGCEVVENPCHHTHLPHHLQWPYMVCIGLPELAVGTGSREISKVISKFHVIGRYLLGLIGTLLSSFLSMMLAFHVFFLNVVLPSCHFAKVDDAVKEIRPG